MIHRWHPTIMSKKIVNYTVLFDCQWNSDGKKKMLAAQFCLIANGIMIEMIKLVLFDNLRNYIVVDKM